MSINPHEAARKEAHARRFQRGTYTLTIEDEHLIRELKAERRRLKKQLAELTDEAIARKFEVGRATIEHI